MKLSKIAAAVAVAFGGISSTQALELSAYDANTIDIYMSGASAQDAFIQDVLSTMAQANTYDAFIGTSGSNQRVFFFQANGIPGIANGTKVMVHKSSVGGSGNGVTPVANQTALAFMNQTATCPASGTNRWTTVPAGLLQYRTRTCTSNGTLVNTPPQIGFSDVEPAIFDKTAAAGLTVSATNDLVFGFALNTKFRNRLQAFQGLTVGAEDEANMPSLNRTQLAGFLTGQLTDYSTAIVDAAGNGLTNTSGGNTTVRICRRVSTSGTQKVTEINLLNVGCSSDAAAMLTNNGTPPVGTVNEGSGTGNLITCLNTWDSNNQYAIGFLSTENVPGTNNYRFIKVDGKSPTLINTVEGKYTYWGALTMQWDRSPALTGNPLSFANRLLAQLQSNTVLEGANFDFRQSFGDGGYLSPATNSAGVLPAATPRVASGSATNGVRENAVNVLSRDLSGSGDPKNCQPPAPLSATVSQPAL